LGSAERQRSGDAVSAVSDEFTNLGEEVAAHAALQLHRSLTRRVSPDASVRKPVPVTPRAASTGAFGHIVCGSTQIPSAGVWTTTVFRLSSNSRRNSRSGHRTSAGPLTPT